MIDVDLITGTRPQIIKSAPVIHELLQAKGIDLRFIHTGQHYDDRLFMSFVKELSLPVPIWIRRHDEGPQLPHLMMDIDAFYEDNQHPDILIVPGDTNSALAAAIVGVNNDIPIAHMEGGVRCWNMDQVEERNRRLIDNISSVIFCPTRPALTNLQNENVFGDIVFTGDTNYDLFLERQYLGGHESLQFLNEHGIEIGGYYIVTIHRAENTTPKVLSEIVRVLNRFDTDMLFPIHPRTRAVLSELDISLRENIRLIDSVGYDVMRSLVSFAQLVITDSGGLQKEALFNRTPCVTIAESTPWPQTIDLGGNTLSGYEPDIMFNVIKEMSQREIRDTVGDLFGNGLARKKIRDYILERFT